MNVTDLSQIVTGRFAAVLAIICTSACTVTTRAGETSDKPAPSPTEEEVVYNNWIELGIGGLIIHGDSGQFKQAHGVSGDVFGGIEDLHYEHALGKSGTFSVDGH